MREIKTYFEGIEPFATIDKMDESELRKGIESLLTNTKESINKVREYAKSLNLFSCDIRTDWNVNFALCNAYPILSLYRNSDRLYYYSYDDITKAIKGFRERLSELTYYVLSFNDKKHECKLENNFPINAFETIIGVQSTVSVLNKESTVYQYSEEDYKKIKHILTFSDGTFTDEIISKLTIDYLDSFLKGRLKTKPIEVYLTETSASKFQKDYYREIIFEIGSDIRDHSESLRYVTIHYNAYLVKEAFKSMYNDYKKSILR